MEIEEEPHIRTNPQRRSRFLMEIVRLVESKFLSVAEKILEVLEGNCDFRAFEAKLKKELDSLGCEILKEVLETLDRKYRESEERKHVFCKYFFPVFADTFCSSHPGEFTCNFSLKNF